MGKKATSMKEIAYELHISINTVSRAFRDCDDISEETKEKVRKKAIELGYVPTSISQLVKRDGKRTIALFYNSSQNLYYNIINQKLIDAISKDANDITLIHASGNTLTIDHIKQCLFERVDAIITSLHPTDDAIELAKMHDIKLVCIGEYDGEQEISTVCVNNSRAGELAAKYLLNYHKATKFIYIGFSSLLSSNKRKDGFVDEIKKAIPDPDIVFIEDSEIEKSNMIEYIYSGYLNIFCFNDCTAYKLIKELEKSVPSIKKVFPHLHIVGVDALSECIDGLVDLTSISFDYEKIASSAYDILKQIWSKKTNGPTHIVIETSLHQRLS